MSSSCTSATCARRSTRAGSRSFTPFAASGTCSSRRPRAMPARGQEASSGPAGWLRRPGRWLAGRTLRGRLVAGLLVLLAIACATVGTVTYAHLHSVLIGQLDEQLVAA